ncbi:methyl-accepting chemotaxis protein [Halomonas sp. PR-M31]|uniref:methyl-accepting chemotaxis protein n=1 Tax=Halomonas sp. PR-M31 TaxID=1471202 RepID=UPI00069FC102|nr:methyl-accepting chemotaxis protein [Halomonas sp. PR-M31]
MNHSTSNQIPSSYRQRIDRVMWTLALLNLVICLAVGVLNGSWPTVAGFALTAVPLAYLITRTWAGTLLSGMTMAALFMGFAALLIDQTQGMIEAHFSIFIMLSTLILYCDWQVILAGAGVIAAHHVGFTYLQYLGWVHIYQGVTPSNVMHLIMCLAMHAGAVVVHTVILGYLSNTLRQVIGDGLSITDFAREAEQGKLDAEFTQEQRRRPAIEAIASMQAKLTSVLKEVRQTAVTVHTLSAETTEAQQILHQQAQRSAEQIERTASSTEELSTTTRQNAAEAERTNQLASKTGETVRQGAESVAKLSETMSHIDEGARDIAKLLGEIDNITFQTNLLALNASVEAARAGEQGRGFAVVANEVRGLSERTAHTAQSIRERVDHSNQQVKSGVEQVSTTGELMQRVVEAFQQVSSRMNEITTSSHEQNQGIETLNASILEMQEALTLSASSIDSTKGVAERLEEAAQYLTTTIGYFHLENETAQTSTLQEHAFRQSIESPDGAAADREWQESARPLTPA